MKLWICESPNKCATIKQLLSKLGYNDFTVMASAGHIIQIKDTGKYHLGIDVNNGFEIDYAVMPEKRELVSQLKQAVKAADVVYLGSDLDREGEVIAWSLQKFLNIPVKKCKRVRYSELTERAIKDAIDNASTIDHNLVAAGQARSCLDKIVGYRLSGIAKRNVGARSVGRCQSAGLKLIAQREDEISAFKPESYFDLFIHINKNMQQITGKYYGTENKEPTRVKDEKQVKQIEKICNSGKYIVSNIAEKQVKENPKPPYCTSTYQQDAAHLLGISIKTAMSCAQQLFEGINLDGKHLPLITYHRTDSETLSNDFVNQVKYFTKNNLPTVKFFGVRKVKAKETAQEGHEALRPVDINITPDILATMIPDQRLVSIYKMIWTRAICSLLDECVYDNKIITIENTGQFFRIEFKKVAKPGFRSIAGFTTTEEKEALFNLDFTVGEVIKNTQLEAVKKETKPPARYDEASLVRELDKRGIGRPSTYAAIVSVLLDKTRSYCYVQDKKIIATALGMTLSRFLDITFADIINLNYTAELESSLDLIAAGKLNSIEFLTEFYKNLESSIKAVSSNLIDIGFTKMCPRCGKPLKVRSGKYNSFYGCSGYPECAYTESIV